MLFCSQHAECQKHWKGLQTSISKGLLLVQCRTLTAQRDSWASSTMISEKRLINRMSPSSRQHTYVFCQPLTFLSCHKDIYLLAGMAAAWDYEKGSDAPMQARLAQTLTLPSCCARTADPGGLQTIQQHPQLTTSSLIVGLSPASLLLFKIIRGF